MPNDKQLAKIGKWLKDNSVEDVEILIGDFAGISRGKKLSVEKFISAIGSNGLRLPESLFGMTIDCDFIANDYITDLEVDVYLTPDIATAGLVPWCQNPTAFFICDIRRQDGTPLDMAPREILRRIVALYSERGWKPIVAPEFEFSLLARDSDGGESPSAAIPPTGKSGRQIIDKGVLSVDGITEFDALFDDVQSYCRSMGLPIGSLVQEAGVGQFEINVTHGDPLQMADYAFLFKRLMRWAAVKHGFYASFMAKPYPADFGNAMHIHQSVYDEKTETNLFADEKAKDTGLFLSHIGGLQKYAAASMPMFAPYENSYLRMNSNLSCPVNTHWGLENRSVGLRVPAGGRESRRIENRIAGSDSNPYLAIAASLLCGYLGMIEGTGPSEPVTGSGYDLTTNALPQHIHAALDALEGCEAFRDILGDAFVRTFIDVKKAEIKARSNVLTSWDAKYLLTNV